MYINSNQVTDLQSVSSSKREYIDVSPDTNDIDIELFWFPYSLTGAEFSVEQRYYITKTEPVKINYGLITEQSKPSHEKAKEAKIEVAKTNPAQVVNTDTGVVYTSKSVNNSEDFFEFQTEEALPFGNYQVSVTYSFLNEDEERITKTNIQYWQIGPPRITDGGTTVTTFANEYGFVLNFDKLVGGRKYLDPTILPNPETQQIGFFPNKGLLFAPTLTPADRYLFEKPEESDDLETTWGQPVIAPYSNNLACTDVSVLVHYDNDWNHTWVQKRKIPRWYVGGVEATSEDVNKLMKVTRVEEISGRIMKKQDPPTVLTFAGGGFPSNLGRSAGTSVITAMFKNVSGEILATRQIAIRMTTRLASAGFTQDTPLLDYESSSTNRLGELVTLKPPGSTFQPSERNSYDFSTKATTIYIKPTYIIDLYQTSYEVEEDGRVQVINNLADAIQEVSLPYVFQTNTAAENIIKIKITQYHDDATVAQQSSTELVRRYIPESEPPVPISAGFTPTDRYDLPDGTPTPFVPRGSVYIINFIPGGTWSVNGTTVQAVPGNYPWPTLPNIVDGENTITYTQPDGTTNTQTYTQAPLPITPKIIVNNSPELLLSVPLPQSNATSGFTGQWTSGIEHFITTGAKPTKFRFAWNNSNTPITGSARVYSNSATTDIQITQDNDPTKQTTSADEIFTISTTTPTVNANLGTGTVSIPAASGVYTDFNFTINNTQDPSSPSYMYCSNIAFPLREGATTTYTSAIDAYFSDSYNIGATIKTQPTYFITSDKRYVALSNGLASVTFDLGIADKYAMSLQGGITVNTTSQRWGAALNTTYSAIVEITSLVNNGKITLSKVSGGQGAVYGFWAIKY